MPEQSGDSLRAGLGILRAAMPSAGESLGAPTTEIDPTVAR
jgi:hypothetical protein